jgi:hypothetical protein
MINWKREVFGVISLGEIVLSTVLIMILVVFIFYLDIHAQEKRVRMWTVGRSTCLVASIRWFDQQASNNIPEIFRKAVSDHNLQEGMVAMSRWNSDEFMARSVDGQYVIMTALALSNFSPEDGEIVRIGVATCHITASSQDRTVVQVRPIIGPIP